MSNTPGAQARASTHAGRNRPSDIDELRHNIADIAGGVGDMAVSYTHLTLPTILRV